MDGHYDVIVVGSGSGGGTVAGRLSEDPACSVLLIEAGPDFPDEATRPPAFFTGGALYGARGAGSGPPSPQLDWGYETAPFGPERRTVPLPRGRLVGGSSMTNGCVAVRPRPSDLDAWVAAGATGWSFAEVLPYLEAAERDLAITTYPEELWQPVQRAFVEGCLELGFRFAPDLNAPDAWDGVVGPWPRNRRDEIRMGSLVTSIRAARPRPNFSILAETLVDRVVLDGDRAVGVAVAGPAGAREIRADRVVLAAGAYGTPPILLRSGIGPSADLAALGIVPRHDLPVGSGLMDHPGLVALVVGDEALGRLGWPALAVVGRGEGWWGIPMGFDGTAGIAALGFYLAVADCPRGSITLRSASPHEPPRIDLAYDAWLAGDAFEPVRRDLGRLLATEAFRSRGARDVDGDVPFAERLRQRISSGHHGAGGCAIGAVVDPELRVLGIDGLHVADASVFPAHVTNNPNVTVHMVGEVAAARISGRRPPGGPAA